MCGGGLRALAAAALERALDLPVGVAARDVAPLVARLLPAGDGELDLRAAALEVELRRDEREATLAHLAGERLDLLAVEEELAVAVGVVVRGVALVVRRDVRADEPDFSIAKVAIRALEVRP